MSKCVIVGPKTVQDLVKRYDGIGKPLTRDEKEILMFALYCESKQRGGVVAEAEKQYTKKP